MSTAVETINTASKHERRFERLRYEVILRAASPVAQQERTIGNTSVIMRRRIRQPDGSFEMVPFVTANAMRHQMREASTYALLEAAGLIDNPSLTESAVRLLCNGGTLTGKGDGSKVNLEAYRRLAEVVPPLALFGGCADNRLIPGNLRVEDALLVCWETADSAPGWVSKKVLETSALASCREHVEEHQRVRMDALLQPQKRALLSAGERARVESRLLASETASASADHAAAAESKSTMMPHTFEAVCEGSLFSWGVEADCYTPLEADTFRTAVGVFLRNARVGGRSGTGFGRLQVVAGNRVHIRATHELDGVNFDEATVGELFRAHVAERREEIVQFLGQVVA